MFTLIQAYKTMFRVFSVYENKSQDAETNEKISGMLGFMSVETWKESLPVDVAWYDWKNVVAKITDSDMLSLQQVRQATIDFLNFHYKEFGYPVKWIVDDLNNKPLDDSIWSA